MNNNNIYMNLLLIVILLILLMCNQNFDEMKFADIEDFITKNKYIIMLIIILLFLYFIYYLCSYTDKLDWLSKYFNNNSDSDSDDDMENNDMENNDMENNDKDVKEKKPNVVLYYANWCNHCKKLKPIWNKYYENNKNNTNYDIKAIDCSETCPNPDVKGYPTILISNNKGDVFDFSDDIKNDKDIEKFVNKKLQ
jgi:thiol-disulfide isomerase/thioredoxin